MRAPAIYEFDLIFNDSRTEIEFRRESRDTLSVRLGAPFNKIFSIYKTEARHLARVLMELTDEN
jgi:hypothetical protein